MEISNSTISAIQSENTATLSRNHQMAQEKPPETSRDIPSAAVFCRVGWCRGRRRRTQWRRISKDGCNGGEFTEEKAEVEEKITALQKIVPGGERLAAEKLFEETAEYILALERQVKALRFLAAFVEGSEKEKRRLAG